MNRFPFRSQLAFAALTLSAVLTTGCALGPIDLSGPTPTKVAVNIKGTVHGGQQPVSYTTLQLWSVGTGGYGAAATELTTTTSGTNEYYPGGAKGCSPNALTVSAYVSTGSTITFTTSTNAVKVGQLVIINDGSSSLGGTATLPVLAATTTTVTFADTGDGAVGGTDTGSLTPICYTKPTTDQNGNFLITGDYTAPGASAQLYITATGGNPGLPETGTPPNNAALKLVAPLGTNANFASNFSIIINEVTTAAMAFAANQYFGFSADSFSSSSGGQTGLTNALNTVSTLVTLNNGFPNGAQVLGNATTGTLTATPDTAKLALIADILAACVNDTGPTGTSCTKLLKDVAPTGSTAPTDTLQAAVYMAQNPTSTNTSSSSTNITELFGLATGTSPFAGWHSGYAQPADWTIAVSYGLATAAAGGTYILNEPQWLAFDASGNLWTLNYTDNLTELSPTGVPLFSSPNTFGVAVPYWVAIDPSGNVWFPNGYAATNNPGTTPGKQIVKYSGGTFTEYPTTNVPYNVASDGKGNIFILEGAASTVEELASGASAVTTVASTGMTTTKYSTMTIDSNYNLWITSGASNTTIYEIPYSSSSYGTPVAVTNTALVEGEPLAIDNGNNIWVGNYSTTAPSTAKISAATPTTANQFAVSGATGGIEGVAVDGGGNIWFNNYVKPGTNSFYELNNAGTQLSPTTGWAHTTYEAKGIAVDPSGNVWIGGSYTQTATTQIVELVGGGVPVVTPIAAGLPTTAGGTSTIGTKP